MRVADRDQAHARSPGLEHVCTGAHDRPGRGAVVLAFLLGEVLLDDDARYRGELAFQPVVGLLQLDRDLGRAGRGDQGHPVEVRRVVSTEVRAELAVEAVHHIGRRDRMAIPELHSRPQGEHHRGGRRARNRGQAGLNRAIGCLAQQRLTHQRVGRVLRVGSVVYRVQRYHVPVDGPDHRGHRLGTRRRDRGQARAGRGITRRGTAGRGGRPAGGPGAGRDHHRACRYGGQDRRPAMSAIHLYPRGTAELPRAGITAGHLPGPTIRVRRPVVSASPCPRRNYALDLLRGFGKS